MEGFHQRQLMRRDVLVAVPTWKRRRYGTSYQTRRADTTPKGPCKAELQCLLRLRVGVVELQVEVQERSVEVESACERLDSLDPNAVIADVQAL